MIRLTLFTTFLVLLTNQRQVDAARELYNQSPTITAAGADAKQQYRSAHLREFSPTYMQSRRFHPDQFARDNRDLHKATSADAVIFSSYFYSYGGTGSSQAACHLRSTFCSYDYQCCAGKCRCVRWSVIGKMSCYKKCF